MRRGLIWGALALGAALLWPDTSFAQRRHLLRGRWFGGGSSGVRYVPVYTDQVRYVVPTYYRVYEAPAPPY